MRDSLGKRWINTAGFWLAVFSAAGLVLLTLAGPGIERRMAQRLQQNQAVSAPGDARSTGPDSTRPAAADSGQPYSVDALRWILGVATVGGFLWSLWSLKPASEPE